MERKFTDTPEALALRGLPGWTRKAGSWDEINTVLPDSADLSKLLIYDALAVLPGMYPCVSFKSPPPQTVFILKMLRGEAYVINTEGSDYARYAARVPSYHPVLQ